jgi:LmbE family N-acetylglucosaminyl deacetylase
VNKVLVLAPHPDDETLGCGGTLLRHLAEGDSVHWLIVTAMTPEAGFSAAQRRSRSSEIEKVRKAYGFKGLHSLGFSTTRLDDLPMAEIVRKMGEVFQKLLPEVVYLPFRGDVHTDHRIVFDAAVACTKWFRMCSVRRGLS